MKNTTQFICNQCGYVSTKWMGRCPNCNEWNTLTEQAVAPESAHRSAKAPARAPVAKPLPLSEISYEEFSRFSSGLGELDNVLGGGIVPASLVLLGGDPGIGKSTILTQVAGVVAKDKKVLYVSAEESAFQVKMRCRRLGVDGSSLYVVTENNLEEICALISSDNYALAVVDSIQAVYLPSLSQSAGSISQVRECAAALMRACKSSGTATFIVGHVNKDGAIAGPKVLEHVMDTVLYFEGEHTNNFKILRAVKNRFGSTNEVGIVEMREDGIHGVENPSGILLSENRGKSAGAVAGCLLEGSRSLMIEIQALVAKTVFQMPRRIISGADYNKLVLLIAVLEKKAGVLLYDQDVYVNIMGGLRIDEPSADLPILAAIVSSAKNIPVPKDTAIFGEVGLTGEIRAVQQVEKRLNECIKLGFRRAVLPKANAKYADKIKDKIELLYAGHIYTAVKELFGL